MPPGPLKHAFTTVFATIRDLAQSAAGAMSTCGLGVADPDEAVPDSPAGIMHLAANRMWAAQQHPPQSLSVAMLSS